MKDSEIATSAQLLQLVAKFSQVLPLDANRALVQEVIENKNDPLWVAIRERFAKKSVEGEVTLASLIALGHYDWVDSSITEKYFPMPETLTLGTEPKLFHFDRSISSDDAVKEMEKEGYRPATIWDLIGFGAKNPEEQRKYPIVALGSVAKAHCDHFVACLDGRGSERGLNLSWFGGGWGGCYRFLAVRK